MGVAAIGPILGMAGAAIAARDKKKAAEKIAATAGNVLIPGDIRNFRSSLAQLFGQRFGEAGFMNPSQHPQLSKLQNQIMYFSSPEFFRQQTEKFDPDQIIRDQIEAATPGFQADLRTLMGNVGSQFSAQGNRFSSDLNRQQSQISGDALQEFQSGFEAMMPQLLQTQLMAQGIIPQLIAGQTNAFNTLLGPQLALLQAGTQFGTAGVGGSAAISPALLPGLGASPAGDALKSFSGDVPFLTSNFAANDLASQTPLFNADAAALTPTIQGG